MESEWTVEVVSETVKLRTTNPVFDNDEVLLSICVLLFAVSGFLCRNDVSQLVLVRMLSKTGSANMYVTGLVSKALFWFFFQKS